MLPKVTSFGHKDITEEQMSDLLITLKGKAEVFEQSQADDKTIETFTRYLNHTFKEYRIKRCMQKIAFLAQAAHESQIFAKTEEDPSAHASSTQTFKGRGLIQLTGEEMYRKYRKNLLTQPELLATDVDYIIDSAGWYINTKKVPMWEANDRDDHKAQEAKTYKRTTFKEALGKTTNELSLLMEQEEEKYFWLQSKIINGYPVDEKREQDPNGWQDRQKQLKAIKQWFKYDLHRCNGTTPEQTTQEACPQCGKLHVDLRDKLTFQKQSKSDNCTNTCKSIIAQMGIEAEGVDIKSLKHPHLDECYYQLADENETRDGLEYRDDKVIQGLKYLDDSLDHGYPVLLGVHHTFKYRKHDVINEDTTDHFVVAVGKKCINGELHYIYWDVGTEYGASKEWLLKLTPENTLISVNSYNKPYTVTQIRRNKKDGNYVQFK